MRRAAFCRAYYSAHVMSFISPSVFDQSVVQAANPTFNSLMLANGLGSFGGNIQEYSGSTMLSGGAPNAPMLLFQTSPNHSYYADYVLSTFIVSGPNAGKGQYQITKNAC